MSQAESKVNTLKKRTGQALQSLVSRDWIYNKHDRRNSIGNAIDRLVRTSNQLETKINNVERQVNMLKEQRRVIDQNLLALIQEYRDHIKDYDRPFSLADLRQQANADGQQQA